MHFRLTQRVPSASIPCLKTPPSNTSFALTQVIFFSLLFLHLLLLYFLFLFIITYTFFLEGVRTFATCYDAKYGEIWEWGKGDFGRIQRLCHHSDKLQGRFSAPDVRHRKRYRMKRAWYRMIERIRNLVDEVHKKFIRWLIANHDVILLPKFETSQMTRRCSKRIRGKTARNMLTWSHYRFRMRLLTKVREHPHCRVILCNEVFFFFLFSFYVFVFGLKILYTGLHEQDLWRMRYRPLQIGRQQGVQVPTVQAGLGQGL